MAVKRGSGRADPLAVRLLVVLLGVAAGVAAMEVLLRTLDVTRAGDLRGS